MEPAARYDILIPIELHPGLGFLGESNRSVAGGRISFNGERAFEVWGWQASFHKTNFHQYLIVRCDAAEQDARTAIAKILKKLGSVSVFLDAGVRAVATEVMIAGSDVDLTQLSLFPAGVMPHTSASTSTDGMLVDIAVLSEAFDASFADRPNRQRAEEVYSDVDFEASTTSRLVLIATVLELLAKRAPRDASALALIDRWSEEANGAGREDLAVALGLAREESTTSAIRALMRGACEGAGLSDEVTKRYVRRTAELYRLRSAIVHAGKEATPQEVGEFRAMARLVLTGSTTPGVFSGAVEGFALDRSMHPEMD